VSAIEAERLVPSVAAALGLAQAFGTTVEALFGVQPAQGSGAPQFAWQPVAFPCRYWAAEIRGRTWLFPVENGPRGGLPHDGVAQGADVADTRFPGANRTLVVAGCDPAAGLLAASYRRQGDFRMLVLSRSSAEAMALLEQGLVHAAGIHWADPDAKESNAGAVARWQHGRDELVIPQRDLQLIRIADWEEGLATSPAAHLRTLQAVSQSKLRWIGRLSGAGARRWQDRVRGSRPAPRNVARDHRGVVEAIRSGWADVGISTRLASEEGQLGFLPLGREPYDLCFARDQAAEPRHVALVQAIRSRQYRRILADLPGYDPSETGEIETAKSLRGND
jgi:putative molybdopterin biosynthesis protein